MVALPTMTAAAATERAMNRMFTLVLPFLDQRRAGRILDAESPSIWAF
jgi:hypothetical protein